MLSAIIVGRAVARYSGSIDPEGKLQPILNSSNGAYARLIGSMESHFPNTNFDGISYDVQLIYSM